MALHRLLGMEIGVPDPARLDAFYQEIGFTGGSRSWGPADQPGQITINEAPFRRLREMRVGCEDEEDIAGIAKNLEGLGIASQASNGTLRVPDPVNKWDVVIEPTEGADIPAQPQRIMNRPGDRSRLDTRHSLLTEATPRPPRRLGHIVVGSPDVAASFKFYTEGLGYRVSDIVAGMAFFMRCSPDHHNLLLAPGPVSYLNHYAIEHDDIDSVCRAATLYLREHEDAQIAGPGRHPIGGNMFWYMRDPTGTFFEYFADMDRILDDAGWQVREDWPMEDSWSLWGETRQPEVFFQPPDMPAVIEGWNKAHG